jgi:chromatin remodeling complex protein RSC6
MPKQTKNTKPKKVSKKTSKKVVEPEPVPVEPTPVEPVPVEPTPVESPVSVPEVQLFNYDEEFEGVNTDLKTALTLIKSLSTRVSQLEKRISKDRKVAEKKMRTRPKRVVDPNKPPSGFAKPGPISEELRAFVKIGKDDLIARTMVTQKINQYCKENNLQDDKDKRILHPDATLKKLLRLKDDDKLTYFNLQKYIKVHYPNKDGVFVN